MIRSSIFREWCTYLGVRGLPLWGYFIPGLDGTGTWHISRVVRVSARALFGGFIVAM